MYHTFRGGHFWPIKTVVAVCVFLRRTKNLVLQYITLFNSDVEGKQIHLLRVNRKISHIIEITTYLNLSTYCSHHKDKWPPKLEYTHGAECRHFMLVLSVKFITNFRFGFR